MLVTLKNEEKRTKTLEIKKINLNTFPKLNLLIDLSYMKKFEGTLSEFEKNLNTPKGNPESREIFKVLQEKDILLATSKRYGFQLYVLHIKLLCKLIEEQLFIKKVGRYLDYLH